MTRPAQWTASSHYQELTSFRSAFNSPDRPSAKRRLEEIASDYTRSAPKLTAWIKENLPQGFTGFSLPVAHQRARTGQQETPAPHAQRRTLSQRNVAAPIGQYAADQV